MSFLPKAIWRQCLYAAGFVPRPELSSRRPWLQRGRSEAPRGRSPKPRPPHASELCRPVKGFDHLRLHSRLCRSQGGCWGGHSALKIQARLIAASRSCPIFRTITSAAEPLNWTKRRTRELEIEQRGHLGHRLLYRASRAEVYFEACCCSTGSYCLVSGYAGLLVPRPDHLFCSCQKIAL